MPNRTSVVMVNAPIHPIPPIKGAAVEWWMYQVSQRLDAYDPHLLCLAAPGMPAQEQDGRISFHRIRLGRIYKRIFQKITRLDPWSYAHRVARRIDQLKPAIVHVHNAPALVARLRQLCRWRTQFILHMHNAMALKDTDPAVRLYVNSRYLKDWYAQRYNGLQIDVVTNGVDTGAFRPRWLALEETSAFKQKLGLPADKKILLFVGRVSQEKGVLDLLNAFEKLLTLRHDVFLLLVGELRRDERGGARTDYANKVIEHCARMQEHCRLTGVIAPGDVQNYYALGDLLIVPSEFEEPFGMVAIEAMAAGVPVLAARKGGLVEFIEDGKNGFFIDDTKNADGLATRITQLLDQPEHLAESARQARSYVEKAHSWEQVASQLEREYAKVLAAPKT